MYNSKEKRSSKRVGLKKKKIMNKQGIWKDDSRCHDPTINFKLQFLFSSNKNIYL